MTPPFQTVALIGLGLIGSSIARAVRQTMPGTRLIGYDADAAVRAKAAEIDLVDEVAPDAASAVSRADLIILCVPVGAMKLAASAIAGHLQQGAVVSDVGSSKTSVAVALREALPGISIVPAHPVAGTENSGPEAGFAALFHNRWCILTPAGDADPSDVDRVARFWGRIGAKVEVMDAEHHDLVLAATSHLPHLIAFSMIGTAAELERVTQSEVIKFSAGGFRDFTRIAASDPTMWRDVFLTNKEAVLEMLARFSKDLGALEQAIRDGDGQSLFDFFAHAREIRRGLIYEP